MIVPLTISSIVARGWVVILASVFLTEFAGMATLLPFFAWLFFRSKDAPHPCSRWLALAMLLVTMAALCIVNGNALAFAALPLISWVGGLYTADFPRLRLHLALLVATNSGDILPSAVWWLLERGAVDAFVVSLRVQNRGRQDGLLAFHGRPLFYEARL